MNKLDLPADVVAKLSAVNGPTRVYDAAGKPTAVVVPPDLYELMLDAWADQHYDEEEMARRRAEAGGYTTAEAVAFVRKIIAEHGTS